MSLNARIILAASLVLAIFLALTAVALDQAFRDSARTARQERLLGQLYLLIGEAEVDEDGQLSLPEQLSEPRFGQPGSGLYATIVQGKGKEIWRSKSALNVAIPPSPPLAVGKSSFSRQTGVDGEEFFVYRMGVSWSEGKRRFSFSFSVAEDLAAFDAQLARYRGSLWGWLAAMALLLVLAQAALLRWGLRPLRRVADEIRAIEGGQKERLESNYPSELRALTENLNGLLQRERAQRQRYRDALGDLAHSLKTPLAVMRGALQNPRHGVREEGAEGALARTVEEETARMQRIVDYQLQRAATAGPSTRLASPVEIGPVAQRVVASLDKVYRDRQVRAEVEVPQGLAFHGDQGDLLELLGNLLDNAYKWCGGRVRLSASGEGQNVILVVEDDGPGIPAGERDAILQRGARADQSTPGQGIGLAVVASIVQAYRGTIEVGESAQGGARITVSLPK